MGMDWHSSCITTSVYAPGQRQTYPGEAKKFAPGQQGKKVTKKKQATKKKSID
jgi:hypothetical protein